MEDSGDYEGTFPSIPGSWLINLAIDIIEVVRSIVEDSGDYEGTFPSRSEFVWFLLIHSED